MAVGGKVHAHESGVFMERFMAKLIDSPIFKAITLILQGLITIVGFLLWSAFSEVKIKVEKQEIQNQLQELEIRELQIHLENTTKQFQDIISGQKAILDKFKEYDRNIIDFYKTYELTKKGN